MSAMNGEQSRLKTDHRRRGKERRQIREQNTHDMKTEGATLEKRGGLVKRVQGIERERINSICTRIPYGNLFLHFKLTTYF